MKELLGQDQSIKPEKIDVISEIKELESEMNEKGELAFKEQQDKDSLNLYDRLLPGGYIPSKEKEEEAKKNDYDLQAVIEVLDHNLIIPLDDEISDLIKNSIRKIREQKFSGKELQNKYDDFTGQITELIIKKFPDDKKKQLSGVWQIRYYTVCNKMNKGPRPQSEDASEIGLGGDTTIIPQVVDLSSTDWRRIISSDNIPDVIADGIDIGQINNEQTLTSPMNREREANHRLPNDLELLRLKMGKAMKSGKKDDWDEIIDLYIKYMDALPQYVEHRFSVLDLFKKYKNKEIDEMPRKIISIASGPYEEARANMDFDFLYKELGVETPEIYNMDFSPEMLKKGEASYIDKAISDNKKDLDTIPQNLVGDMRELPIKDGTFDLVECSSTDNLIKIDSGGLTESIIEMIRILKPGGLLRLSYKGKFPNEFYTSLSRLGLELITKPHTEFNVSKNLFEKLSQQNELLALRYKQKLQSNPEYILARKKSDNLPLVDKETDFGEEKIREALPTESEEIELATKKLRRYAKYITDREGQYGNKGWFVEKKKGIVRNLANSLLVEAYHGKAIKEGRLKSVDKEVEKQVLMLIHNNGGKIPEVINEFGLIPRDLRKDMLRQFGSRVYRDLEAQNVI